MVVCVCVCRDEVSVRCCRSFHRVLDDSNPVRVLSKKVNSVKFRMQDEKELQVS